MKFSILTPSFNQARFLEKNLRSVIAQDVKDVEHLVCDGGSTDGSREILERYSPLLTKWVSEPDGGQADALNKALSWATGDIVGWLNSDDYYEPNVLGEVAAKFAADPDLALVYGDYHVVLDDDRVIRRNRPCRFDYDVCLYQAPLVANAAAFFRRDKLLQCGGFDASYQFCMDWELYVRYMRNGARWTRLPRVLGNFRLHAASKTSRLQVLAEEEFWRMRHRERPDLTRADLVAKGDRALRRMTWLMISDGSIFEKVYFQAFRARHFARYFGREPGTLNVPIIGPVLSRVLDKLDPV